MEIDQPTLRVVLPGDVISEATESAIEHGGTIVLGPGLRQEGESIVATKAGILKHLTSGNRWWIESNQKRASSWNNNFDISKPTSAPD